ncbi:MAG: hypothetical protein VR69_03870 [Peptococcaceae bacterium BRH_c4b]|nr:MAG: hypothetical protein VR69_03870 [Peptococcaceae bacterium BRH_c4b]
MIKVANPAPWGVFAFGVAAFVVGAIFAGLFTGEGVFLVGGTVAVFSGVILMVVSYLMLLGKGLGDPGPISSWGAGIFGFFAQVWLILGVILLTWKPGVEGPLAFVLLYTCFVSAGYTFYSYKLGIKSFVLLFAVVVVATLCGFGGLYAGWAQGSVICGYLFFFLGFLGLYIAFMEQLREALPKTQQSQVGAAETQR